MVELFLNVLPISVLCGVIYGIYRFYKCKTLNLSFKIKDESLRILFTVYLAGLFNLTLVPQNFWSDFWFYLKYGYIGETLNPFFTGGYNFIPIFIKCLMGQTETGSWVITMLIGNLLMFFPYGVFVYLLSGKLKFKNTLFISLVIPMFIEVLQPIIGRSCDIDDFLLNALGILLGYYFTSVVFSLYKKLKKHGTN